MKSMVVPASPADSVAACCHGILVGPVGQNDDEVAYAGQGVEVLTGEFSLPQLFVAGKYVGDLQSIEGQGRCL